MTDQIEGRRPVLEALKAGREISEIIVATGSKRTGPLGDILGLAERHGITIRELSRRELDAQAQSRNAQGVIALVPTFDFASMDDLLDGARAKNEPALLVALDGVTDPQNLGALARSAEAAGVHGLLLPRRRSAPVTASAEKASAGALTYLPVASVANLARALEELKGSGVWIVALEAGAKTTIYELELATEPLCLVVGGEGAGVSRLTKDRADALVSIPMSGQVQSLNAAAAGAIALFEIRRRRG